LGYHHGLKSETIIFPTASYISPQTIQFVPVPNNNATEQFHAIEVKVHKFQISNWVQASKQLELLSTGKVTVQKFSFLCEILQMMVSGKAP
jgi:hypothetical protein